jgi:hypothetical protein
MNTVDFLPLSFVFFESFVVRVICVIRGCSPLVAGAAAPRSLLFDSLLPVNREATLESEG